MKRYSIFLFLLISFSVFAQTAESDLERLFRANPGLTTQANPEILVAEARSRLGEDAARRIERFTQSDLTNFMETRSRVITRVRTNPGVPLRRVVVSGQSVTGMVAAAIAAQSGHRVDVYDLRMTYTRDIQWSSRQSLADILASIDPELARRYEREVARDLTRGYSSIDPDGRVTTGRGHQIAPADPRRIPLTGDEMLRGTSVGTVQTRRFEELLYEYLSQHPNVTQQKGKVEFGDIDRRTGERSIREFRDVTPPGQREKVYELIPRTDRPIAVVAEGAGSANRTALGIQSLDVSPGRLQVAGVVHIENGGEIATHYRTEAPGRMITGSMGTTGSNRRWVVADIDAGRITPDSARFGTDVNADAYKVERQRLLEAEFRRIAEMNMRMPAGSLANVRIGGAIDGLPLQTFELTQHISSSAISGNNVLLLGDAVGNGHWSVGGGVHIGAISHVENFQHYLGALDGGRPISEAARAYNESSLADSRAWAREGLHYFYDNLSEEDTRRMFAEAMRAYDEGKISSPQRAVELQAPEGRSATAVRPIRMNCRDIPLRILGDL